MNRLATLEEMNQYYSDLFKSIRGIRPRWVQFQSIDEAGEAIIKLEAEIQSENEGREFWDKHFEERDKFMTRMGTDQKWIPAYKYEALAGEPL